ncbi:cyclin-T1-3-like isoform X1 [Ipomoea triloba]|uniref:cyclin-T1-3-like isoform X1 n=1 Tax=Ipomoea triloba TaxID=35885 RepID=UPI00125D44D5|nr:cyclin-T1-3-like isoform X1 [Ipomoea triloba]
MALAQNYQIQNGPFRSYGRNHLTSHSYTPAATNSSNYSQYLDSSFRHLGNQDISNDLLKDFREYNYNYDSYVKPEVEPSSKRRKFSSSSWGNNGWYSQQTNACNMLPPGQQSTHNNVLPRNQRVFDNISSGHNNNSAITTTVNTSNVPYSNGYTSASFKCNQSEFEGDNNDVAFMSREEIERCSPSRKDGIDVVLEMHLRYSYCAFLQSLGIRLELPQTTTGTSMVLCHRFFLRRSHACHDRFLIATAALFLAAKSEETPCPLNNILRASCEIFHKQDFSYLSYLLPADWFEQYRERIIEAEQMILTTLNFELNVLHPYDPLTSTLEKLGFSHSVLVNMALNLISEGLRSSLWLQFKPNQIAAGAAYLAAKILNMNLASNNIIWQEFQTPPNVLRDVARQLMELL